MKRGEDRNDLAIIPYCILYAIRKSTTKIIYINEITDAFKEHGHETDPVLVWKYCKITHEVEIRTQDFIFHYLFFKFKNDIDAFLEEKILPLEKKSYKLKLMEKSSIYYLTCILDWRKLRLTLNILLKMTLKMKK